MVSAASETLLNRVIKQGAEMSLERFDSWFNAATGMGTARDKTLGSIFCATPRVQDEELRQLYAHNDLAAKIVNIYPREAMRNAYCITGFDTDKNKKAENYLKPWNIKKHFCDWWIWARCFGGGGVWMVTDDGAPPDQPLVRAKKVIALKFYDRRWLNPYTWYRTGPKAGQVEKYMLSSIGRLGVEVGIIHETRLVILGGARTEAQAKLELNDWDYSVLQVCHDALRSEGTVWKSTELLISDANQAVFKIKGLFKMMSTKKGEDLKLRVMAMDLMRSVTRAILLDKEDEDFERKPTNFTGLPDLTDRSIKRLASAAEIPVTVLMGEAPAGLNATGDSDLQWFFARVRAEQEQYAEPSLLQLMGVLFSQDGSPISEDELTDLALKWNPLWEATAKERAEIYKLRAEGGAIQVQSEILLPEEVAVSEYGKEDGGEIEIDVTARQKIIEANNKRIAKMSTQTPTDPAADPAALPPAGTTPGVTPPAPGKEGQTPAPAGNEPPPVADPNATAKDPASALNGAQVTALLDIVDKVALKELPRESGIALIVAAFPISPESAEQIMGDVGKTFFVDKPEPPPAFGGAPADSPSLPSPGTKGETPPKPGDPKPSDQKPA